MLADSCLIGMTHLLIRFEGKQKNPYLSKAVLSLSHGRKEGLFASNSAQLFKVDSNGKLTLKRNFAVSQLFLSFVQTCKQN